MAVSITSITSDTFLLLFSLARRGASKRASMSISSSAVILGAVQGGLGFGRSWGVPRKRRTPGRPIALYDEEEQQVPVAVQHITTAKRQ